MSTQDDFYKMGHLLGQGGFAAVYEARVVRTPTADMLAPSLRFQPMSPTARSSSTSLGGTDTFSPAPVQRRHAFFRAASPRFGQRVKPTQVRSGDKLAVKVIKRTKLRRDKELQRLVAREIEALTLLRGHPHVCQLISVRDTHRGKCLAMEFLQGGTLFGLVRRKGKLSEEQTRQAFRGIASAIRFCHRRGIVHRDIKAENVLLARTGDPSTAKLCDFGLAARDLDAAGAVKLYRKQYARAKAGKSIGGVRAASSSSPEPPAPRKLTLKAGTALYSPPEVLAADGSYDGRAADIFSLGVLLFVCITGHFPFIAPNDQALRRSMMSKPPDYRRFRAAGCMPAGTEELLRGMLCPEPADRMKIDAVCQHSWTGLGPDSDAAYLAGGSSARGGGTAGLHGTSPLDHSSHSSPVGFSARDFELTPRGPGARRAGSGGKPKKLGSSGKGKGAARLVPSPVNASAATPRRTPRSEAATSRNSADLPTPPKFGSSGGSAEQNAAAAAGVRQRRVPSPQGIMAISLSSPQGSAQHSSKAGSSIGVRHGRAKAGAPASDLSVGHDVSFTGGVELGRRRSSVAESVASSTGDRKSDRVQATGRVDERPLSPESVSSSDAEPFEPSNARGLPPGMLVSPQRVQQRQRLSPSSASPGTLAARRRVRVPRIGLKGVHGGQSGALGLKDLTAGSDATDGGAFSHRSGAGKVSARGMGSSRTGRRSPREIAAVSLLRLNKEGSPGMSPTNANCSSNASSRQSLLADVGRSPPPGKAGAAVTSVKRFAYSRQRKHTGRTPASEASPPARKPVATASTAVPLVDESKTDAPGQKVSRSTRAPASTVKSPNQMFWKSREAAMTPRTRWRLERMQKARQAASKSSKAFARKRKLETIGGSFSSRGGRNAILSEDSDSSVEVDAHAEGRRKTNKAQHHRSRVVSAAAGSRGHAAGLQPEGQLGQGTTQRRRVQAKGLSRRVGAGPPRAKIAIQRGIGGARRKLGGTRTVRGNAQSVKKSEARSSPAAVSVSIPVAAASNATMQLDARHAAGVTTAQAVVSDARGTRKQGRPRARVRLSGIKAVRQAASPGIQHSPVRPTAITEPRGAAKAGVGPSRRAPRRLERLGGR